MAAGLTQILAETTNGQTITYLYGLGLVAQSMNGVAEYNLTDGLGSVRQLTNAGGQVLLSQTFDPYGNRYQQARGDVLWDATSPFGWAGEQSDPSGLTYLRARYYAPGMGRFTQLDPFAGALAIPATMNPYGYAHSSPLMYTDPSGELVLLTALLVGALIGGALGFGITYGTELYAHRSIIEKEGFWAAQKHLDWGRIGVATAIGAVSGAMGFGAGWAATAGMYEVAAGLYAANLAWDIGTDMGVYGDTFLDAYTANMAFAMLDMPGPGDEMLFKAAAHGFADDAGEAAGYVRRNVSERGRTLLIGEGNFSYARSLVENRLVDPHNLVATSYESLSEIRRLEDATQILDNIAYLEGEGVRVLHGINAKRLHEMPGLGQFDQIGWNFPHAGPQNIRVNQHLLNDFFGSAKARLTPEGRIAVVLQDKAPYLSWDIVSRAKSQGLVSINKVPFDYDYFYNLGYRHRRTLAGASATIENPFTYYFGLP